MLIVYATRRAVGQLTPLWRSVLKSWDYLLWRRCHRIKLTAVRVVSIFVWLIFVQYEMSQVFKHNLNILKWQYYSVCVGFSYKKEGLRQKCPVWCVYSIMALVLQLLCCPAIPPVDKVLFDKGDALVARLDTSVTAGWELYKRIVPPMFYLHRLVLVVEFLVIQRVLHLKFA